MTYWTTAPASSASADPALLDEDSDYQEETPAAEPSSGSCTITPMDESTSVLSTDTSDLLYHQCKTARRTAFTDKLVSISGDGTFGTCVSSQSPPVVNLTDHEGLDRTFHGSRIREGSETVNQSISVSFDPSKFTCVSCKTEHTILGKKPVTVFFSDQNFIPKLEGHKDSCLNIVRMEDASLSDLSSLQKKFSEILDSRREVS
jgi:hypothetical protein